MISEKGSTMEGVSEKIHGSDTEDRTRVVACVDADAFYAQCEELRDPSLKEVPVAITQKFLVVTCNYPARGRGVRKLMPVTEARKVCPEIKLVNGEDLRPYRAVSKRMMAILRRFGPVQRIGLDEAWVDITTEVEKRSELVGGDAKTLHFSGHIHDPREDAVVQESQVRVMDLRADKADAVSRASSCWHAENIMPWHRRLAVASIIIEEARHALAKEIGLRTSAGISCNKLVSKLVSGLHKPNDQTILFPEHAAEFVAALPLRSLPGVGTKLEQQLSSMGISSVASLRCLTVEKLTECFGDRIGNMLAMIRWGTDATPVVDQGPPKSITVEDSFRECSSFAAVDKVIDCLAPDLIARIREDSEEHERHPTRLVVSWRPRGNSYRRLSASQFFPLPALQWSKGKTEAECTSHLADACFKLLKSRLREPFHLTLINIGATSFSQAPLQREERNLHQMLTAGRRGDESTVCKEAPDVGEGAAGATSLCDALASDGGVKDIINDHNESQFYTLSKNIVLQMKNASRGALQNSPGAREDPDTSFWNDISSLHCANKRQSIPADERESLMQISSKKEHFGFPVVMHLDVDCFYVQVERMDDPSLFNRPVAVEQLNRGGFVSVSYEARQAGIRCGDGVGDAGRAAIPYLREIKSRSIEQCRAICPGLVVRSMRPDRYREISEALMEFLKSFLPESCIIEKTSCDDFYVDVSEHVMELTHACNSRAFADLSRCPPKASLVLDQSWTDLSTPLKFGAFLGDLTRASISSRLGLIVSCGVANSKLASRLASPLHKPDGLTIVSHVVAKDFLRGSAVRTIPGLKGKLGKEIENMLHVHLVGDLEKFAVSELCKRFGPKTGTWLGELARGIDTSKIVETDAQKTMMVERSFSPTNTRDRVHAEIQTLANLLLERLCRLPDCRPVRTLRVLWRQGYPNDTSMGRLQSKSTRLSAELVEKLCNAIWLRDSCPATCQEIVDLCITMLRGEICHEMEKWNLSRLGISVSFEENKDVEAKPRVHLLDKFLLKKDDVTGKEKAQPATVSGSSISASNCSKSLGLQKEIGYRNAEAIALQKLFKEGGAKIAADISLQRMSPEEKASVELAYHLQYDEINHHTSNVESKRKRMRQGPLDHYVFRR